MTEYLIYHVDLPEGVREFVVSLDANGKYLILLSSRLHPRRAVRELLLAENCIEHSDLDVGISA